MSPVLLPLLACSLLSLFGDVMCKYATTAPSNVRLGYTLSAGFAWFMTAFSWVAVYRSHSLLEVLIWYTPVHSVLVGVAGIMLFGDAFTPKLAAGAVLSALAVWVMS